jgi:Na+/H+ antiporter NhaD/arsenite permease-like protein
VFAYVADKAAWLARGSTWRLWILVVLVATVSAAVLSLDTTAVLLTPVVLALASRKSLRGSYRQVPIHPSPDRLLLVIAMIVCGLLGPAFAAGIDVTLGSAVAALILTVSCLLRAPQMLSWRLVPWLLILGVAVLFVLVQMLHDHELTPLLDAAAGQAERLPDLLQLTAVAAVGANGINNLPAYLAHLRPPRIVHRAPGAAHRHRRPQPYPRLARPGPAVR